jgi:hypothetical protein
VIDMVGSMPMRRMLRFPGIPVNHTQLKLLLVAANNPLVKRVATFFGGRRPS